LEDRSWEKVDDWMRLYGDRIMRAVYLIVDDYHLAEEITQEVFVKSYHSLQNFRGEASPYTWLYRIAINLSRDYLKRKSKVKFLPLLAEEQHSDNLAESLEDKIARLTTGKRIRDCINKLPLIYREVIILYYFEDMKLSNIAQILKQSEGTIKSKLSRGREFLENTMRKEGLVNEEE